MAFFAFRPLIQLAGVHDYLTGWVKLNLSAVHRSRRRALEVDPLAGIAASMARTFELVLARLPVRCASQVSASGIDHKQSFGIAHDPDAILLLELCIDPKPEVRCIAYSKNGAWFE